VASSSSLLRGGGPACHATVVERTWRFSRPDGSPDPRYKRDNVQIPIVLYGLLEIGTPSGLKVRLEVSDRLAAARFARTFVPRSQWRNRRRRRLATAKNTTGQIKILGAPLRRRGTGAPFRGDAGEGDQRCHGTKGSRGGRGCR